MAKPSTQLSSTLTGAEKLALLNCRRLPARLDVAQTAALLNFGEHDIRFLSSAGLIAALGKPAPNAPKYFAAVEVAALAESREWLEKASKAISGRWREKNSRTRQDNDLGGSSRCHAAPQRLKVP